MIGMAGFVINNATLSIEIRLASSRWRERWRPRVTLWLLAVSWFPVLPLVFSYVELHTVLGCPSDSQPSKYSLVHSLCGMAFPRRCWVHLQYWSETHSLLGGVRYIILPAFQYLLHSRAILLWEWLLLLEVLTWNMAEVVPLGRRKRNTRMQIFSEFPHTLQTPPRNYLTNKGLLLCHQRVQVLLVKIPCSQDRTSSYPIITVRSTIMSCFYRDCSFKNAFLRVSKIA